jgi:hypothetical protein
MEYTTIDSEETRPYSMHLKNWKQIGSITGFFAEELKMKLQTLFQMPNAALHTQCCIGWSSRVLGTKKWWSVNIEVGCLSVHQRSAVRPVLTMKLSTYFNHIMFWHKTFPRRPVCWVRSNQTIGKFLAWKYSWYSFTSLQNEQHYLLMMMNLRFRNGWLMEPNDEVQWVP